MFRLNRRSFIRTAAALFSACLFAAPAFAQESGKKKVLFLTKSSGFQHSVIARNAANPSARWASLKMARW